MNKTLRATMLALLFICASLLGSNIRPTRATTIRVPSDYLTIQQAINAANPGDTIIVSPGTYQEQILINFKNSLTVIAEDPSNTIIQGEVNKTVVSVIHSNSITFQGFIVRGTGYTYPQFMEWWIEVYPLQRVGILVHYSSDVKLENNTVVRNLYGVRLYYSNNVTMRDNNLADNVYNFGVDGGGSLSCYLHNIGDSNFVNGKRIYYEVNQSDLIIDSFSYSDAGYLGLVNSQNITVKNLNISNNLQGLLLAYTNNSRIQNVDVSYNAFGLQLTNSAENLLENNEILTNAMGLWIQGFGGNGYGPPFFNNNTVSANKILNNTLGMILTYSGGNILRFNNMTGNMFNFGVFGSGWDYVEDIDASNTVDGKPIYYLVDKHDQIVPSDAGYVAAVWSTNITVKDLTLSNNIQGVLFACTSSSLIENVVASDNFIGIHLSRFFWHPSGNIISRSLVINNLMAGIWLAYDSGDAVIGNIISSNYMHGIFLFGGDYNSIICNTISNNSRGIYFDECSGRHYVINNTLSDNDEGIRVGYWSGNCTIYHNNFINNTKQATVDQETIVSAWDDGYPSGGNYWSDYNGADLYSGPFQNETGSDGIGDTPYVIRENEMDNYPLMSPWVPEDTTPPTIGVPSRQPDDIVLPYQEVKVSVSVTDAISGVKNVTLFYTTDNGTTWQSLPMNYNSSTSKYEATIPGQPEDTLVRYKIVAYDYAGNNATLDGEEIYCTYEVIPEFPSATIIAFTAHVSLTALILTARKSKTNKKRDTIQPNTSSKRH